MAASSWSKPRLTAASCHECLLAASARLRRLADGQDGAIAVAHHDPVAERRGELKRRARPVVDGADAGARATGMLAAGDRAQPYRGGRFLGLDGELAETPALFGPDHADVDDERIAALAGQTDGLR